MIALGRGNLRRRSVAGSDQFQFGLLTDGVIGLVHGEAEPDDAAWEAHHQLIFETMGPERFSEIGYFVITAGGAPTTKQRRMGNRAVKGRKMVRSIVTDSFFVRQLVTSWSWFAPGMTAYHPSQMRLALLNVGVKPEQLDEVWAKVWRLSTALKPAVPWIPEKLA